MNIKRTIKNYLRSFIKKVQYEEIKLQISGENNNINNNKCFKNCVIHIEGNNNLIEIEESTIISNSTIYIAGDNHKLIISENCIFNNSIFYFEDYDCQIRIGSKTTAGGIELAVTEPGRSILIGNDCMFSHPIEIRTGDSHTIIDLVSNKRINYAADVIIEDHVWIGAHAKVLKGVTVGTNSIVGTNSVVTQSVPPNTLVAGIPAKKIKENITWKRERIYQ